MGVERRDGTSTRSAVGYDPAQFHVLARLEANSFWFQARNELIAWALERFFGGAQRVLEVGVGTGFALRALRAALPGAQLCAGDFHMEGLRYAAERLGRDAVFLRLDATALPFGQYFDVVCAFDVLEHIEDDRRALAELHRVIRPGGGIVLTVPQHQRLWSPADAAAGHARRYLTTELKEKATEAGFDVLFKTSFISLLLPAMYLSRARSRSAGAYDLPDELLIHPALNFLLRQVCDVERFAIRQGARFPAGGSQLLVAIRR